MGELFLEILKSDKSRDFFGIPFSAEGFGTGA